MTGKRRNLADLLEAGTDQDKTPVSSLTVAPGPVRPTNAPAYAPLEQFSRDPRNHRTNLGDLADLAARMRKLGQLQPVVAVSAARYKDKYFDFAAQIPDDAEYVVIMGERRLGAARLGDLGRLMYLLNDALLDAEDYREAALDENWRREDLTCLDDARLLQDFLALDRTQQKVADRIGRSQGFVAQRLALLNLVSEAQDAIDTRKLGFDQARKLTTLSPDDQRAAVARLLGTAEARESITAVIKPVSRASTSKWVRRYRVSSDVRELGTVLAEEFDSQAFTELVQAGAETLTDLRDLDEVLRVVQAVRDSKTTSA